MQPLANKIRPDSLDEYRGQQHLVGAGMPLRVAIEQKHLFSFILWGPPGVGKTTLARIYAKTLGAEFFELSAVSAGKDDIRKIVETPSFLGKPKILFLDEIHRFNKAQQDFLLPYVETGKLYFIGATTENPSFEVIAALLSRCQVFTLTELGEPEIKSIVYRAVENVAMDGKKIKIPPQAVDWLIAAAGGDARQVIAIIENTLQLYGDITVQHLSQAMQSKQLRYDKAGEEHYNTVSAFIKSMRASQPDAALYYLARMVEAGEDPLFIARRMVIFASEDIGVHNSHALTLANAVFRACETVGYPECAINLSHAAVYLSLCKKGRESYEAYTMAAEDVKTYGNLPIPLNIRNAPTKLMKTMGYGQGYEQYTNESLLPKKLAGKKYFKAKKDE